MDTTRKKDVLVANSRYIILQKNLIKAPLDQVNMKNIKGLLNLVYLMIKEEK